MRTKLPPVRVTYSSTGYSFTGTPAMHPSWLYPQVADGTLGCVELHPDGTVHSFMGGACIPSTPTIYPTGRWEQVPEVPR